MVEAETFLSCYKAPIPIAGSSKTFFLQIFKEFCYMQAIRSTVMLLSSSHNLVVSIANLHLMPDCIYSVQGALSSNHNVFILMVNMDNHGTSYSLP